VTKTNYHIRGASMEYKKLKWNKKLLKNKPFEDACRCNDKRALFTITTRGKEKVFYIIMTNIHRNTTNNEYIYIDRKRESLIRTGIYVGESPVGILTTEDVLDWIEVYEQRMDKHEHKVKENRLKAVKKMQEAKKKKAKQKKTS
jgi:hypothetical protein